MRTRLRSIARLAFVPLVAASAFAFADGEYGLDWHTIDGGGVMHSSDGTIELSGTIGQPDASAVLTDGDIELVGGYWAAILPDPCTHCGDLDDDGDVDRDDYEAFLEAFALGLGQEGFTTCADYNGDATVTWLDFAEWVRCYRDYVGNPAAPLPGVPRLGDLNADGSIDGRDIQRFVDVVLYPDSASVIELLNADANGDSQLDEHDVEAFVDVLVTE